MTVQDLAQMSLDSNPSTAVDWAGGDGTSLVGLILGLLLIRPRVRAK